MSAKNPHESFILSDLERIAVVAEDKGDHKTAERIRQGIEKRTEVNEAAVKITEEYGSDSVASLLHLMAQENKEAAMILEMGWFVDGFSGIIHCCNTLSTKAIFVGRDDAAVMWRAFALAIGDSGVDPVDDPMADRLIRAMYAFSNSVEFPSNEEWDKARAHSLLANISSELAFKETLEDENS